VEQQSKNKVDKLASQQQQPLRQHTEIIMTLGADKTTLDNSIEHLQAFESDYRTHLTRLLHAQLQQLGAQDSPDPQTPSVPSKPRQPPGLAAAPRHPRPDLHRTNTIGDLRWAHKTVRPTQAKVGGAQHRDWRKQRHGTPDPPSSATETPSWPDSRARLCRAPRGTASHLAPDTKAVQDARES
jgi:hypothetical protein